MNFEEACKILGGPLEPTSGEARNGWTRESLTVYHAEREVAKADSILNPPKQKPIRTTQRFRWP